MIGESLNQRKPYLPVKFYLLNSSNCFVWFSPEWKLEFQDAFPKPYDVRDYLGLSFFDVLADSSIRHIYSSIFERVRQPGSKPWSLTMRCDNFPLKILMSQELKAADDGHIQVEIAYVHLEKMNEDAQAILLNQTELLKMCSWCQSILDNNQGVWLPLEKALGFFPLLHEPELPAITHGCCPACLKNLRGKLS